MTFSCRSAVKDPLSKVLYELVAAKHMFPQSGQTEGRTAIGKSAASSVIEQRSRRSRPVPQPACQAVCRMGQDGGWYGCGADRSGDTGSFERSEEREEQTCRRADEQKCRSAGVVLSSNLATIQYTHTDTVKDAQLAGDCCYESLPLPFLISSGFVCGVVIPALPHA